MFCLPPSTLLPDLHRPFVGLRSYVIGFASVFLRAIQFFLPESCDDHGHQFSTSCHMCIKLRHKKVHASKTFQASVRKRKCRHFHAICYVNTHQRLSVDEWRQRYRTKLEKKPSLLQRTMHALGAVASILRGAKDSVLNVCSRTILAAHIFRTSLNAISYCVCATAALDLMSSIFMPKDSAALKQLNTNCNMD